MREEINKKKYILKIKKTLEAYSSSDYDTTSIIRKISIR